VGALVLDDSLVDAEEIGVVGHGLLFLRASGGGAAAARARQAGSSSFFFLACARAREEEEGSWLAVCCCPAVGARVGGCFPVCCVLVCEEREMRVVRALSPPPPPFKGSDRRSTRPDRALLPDCLVRFALCLKSRWCVVV
jgi:hypothetical protein